MGLREGEDSSRPGPWLCPSYGSTHLRCHAPTRARCRGRTHTTWSNRAHARWSDRARDRDSGRTRGRGSNKIRTSPCNDRARARCRTFSHGPRSGRPETPPAVRSPPAMYHSVMSRLMIPLPVTLGRVIRHRVTHYQVTRAAAWRAGR